MAAKPQPKSAPTTIIEIMERTLLFTFGLETDAQGNRLRSPAIAVKATTDLGSFPESAPRQIIRGQLRGVSQEQLVELSCGCDTQVIFEEGDAAYRFVKLSEEGSFELIRMNS